MDENESVHVATLLNFNPEVNAHLVIYRDGTPEPLRLTYKSLHVLAKYRAGLLRRSGIVRDRQIILIHLHSQLENMIWFWAAVFAGCIPVMSTPLSTNKNNRLAHFAHLQQLLLDPVVLTTEKLITEDFMDDNILDLFAVEDIESSCSRISKPRRSIFVEEPIVKDVAMMLLTSGSSGDAKAVCLTHGQIFAAVKGKQSMLPSPQGSALLNWIALDHAASLIEIHLCALYAGINQVHVPTATVLADPLTFLYLITKHNVSRTFAPHFFLCKLENALEKASPQERELIDLKQLLHIASGGEANSADNCTRLTEYFRKLGASRENIITPGFGMTETCAGVIFNMNCPSKDRRPSRFVHLGQCMPGIEMRIVPTSASHGRPVDDHDQAGIEGALEVRGPVVFKRYFNDAAATGAVFSADGWFRTGDLAFIDACGNLSLIGRTKDLININGVKHSPGAIEHALTTARIPGVAPSFVTCFAHRFPSSLSEDIYVVYQRCYDAADSKARTETLTSIVRVVTSLTGKRPYVLPLSPGTLQRTTLGKLSRAKTHSLLMDGAFQDEEDINTQTLQFQSAMSRTSPRDDVELTISTILCDLLSLDGQELDIDGSFLDFGISSVELIQLKSRCEKAFGIPDIPIISIMNNTTIRSFAEVLRRRMRATHYSESYDPVVVLQEYGRKTPLWLFHPGIGEILVFLGLVKYFPDRPIYALRARGFNSGENPFKNVNEILDTYHTAIKKKQPHGPYAMAGYSYGSMLAFEVAKKMQTDGDEIRFLGSFNLPPHIKDRMRKLDWTAGLLHISHFCRIISEEKSEKLARQLQGQGLDKSQQVKMLLQNSDQKRCQELAITLDSLLTWVNVAWSLQKVGWEYEPSGCVSHMDVFYCQPLKVVARTREEYRQQKLDKWKDFVRDDVQFHEVDGEHYTMIGPEHVFKFQQRLKQVLAARGV